MKSEYTRPLVVGRKIHVKEPGPIFKNEEGHHRSHSADCAPCVPPSMAFARKGGFSVSSEGQSMRTLG